MLAGALNALSLWCWCSRSALCQWSVFLLNMVRESKSIKFSRECRWNCPLILHSIHWFFPPIIFFSGLLSRHKSQIVLELLLFCSRTVARFHDCGAICVSLILQICTVYKDKWHFKHSSSVLNNNPCTQFRTLYSLYCLLFPVPAYYNTTLKYYH